MKKLNPIEKSQYINKRYKEYLRSSFEFGKSKLQKLFSDQLENEILFKGPYVDMRFPCQRGKNIDELIDEGIICKSFRKLGSIDFKRPLFTHQEEAIRLVGKGRSAVITTGTGTGKTECFLYPILNEIMSEIENGDKSVGIRTIFLYPMNALVNDQFERIRKILQNCSDVKYGFFTGDTPEQASSTTREKIGKENNTVIPDNELVSREEIRENPPHILFTNYSMLEYLLIRPNDYALFEPERLKNWKYVVLDEAHTYSGSLGIELSLLLRRLTGLSEKKPQFILTSATLGTQGKSENEIVKFAKNLTSAEFDINDIIFSKRIVLNYNPLYRIDGKDYSYIKENINSFSAVNTIAQKYCNSSAQKVNGLLYDLLSKDNNVLSLCELLKDGTKEFIYIYENLKEFMSETQLIDLIDIINYAEKDGIGLFEFKYHSFVRTLSGAYITFGDTPQLSLTKTNEINGMKAFELGNCKYCNSSYIIGKIQKKEGSKVNYLLQNKEIDIYENYGNEEFVKIDYFLLENNVNEDEVESEIIEPCEVCAKCGEIHEVKNLNAQKCTCDDSNYFTIYKVISKKKKNEDTLYNNIIQCPCCGHKSKSGVVKALDIGKDEGTAIIAQILYEAIDNGDEVKTTKTKLSLKPVSKIINETTENKVKQYLAFSDSRQQASFFSVFLNANHVRLLRKRLIWEIIQKHDYADMKLDAVVSYLEDMISSQNLFDNKMNAHKNAWATVLVDLLKVDGSYDGEGLGLYYFDVDLAEILDELDDSEIEEFFGNYNCKMNKNELYTLIQVVMNIFKVTPAVNYVRATLDPDEKKEALEYRRFDKNYIMLSSQKSQKNIRSLLPVTGEENIFVRYVKKAFGCTSSEACEILSAIFNLLVQASDSDNEDSFLRKEHDKEAYQINAGKYILRNYKSSKYYKCEKCKRLTPHNLRGICPQDKCPGTLVEIDPDIELKNNYYRKQYKEKKIEKISVREHTAQLERKHAKEYQNDFKNKKINILSCSTTFEMGIDIGGLETVFMRNVPPTPANYVQRAGRAGRRNDSAAYILTYCGKSSHDFTYFTEPEKMISGIIDPPCFNVHNKKIITRHLMASSLGFFFRQYPEYFHSLIEMVKENGGADSFNEYINSHPDDLNKYINTKILPENEYSEFRNFKWFDDMGGKDEKLTQMVNIINENLNEYKTALQNAIDSVDSNLIGYYQKQIENIKNEHDLISYLSKYCVIPQYGFPVDVVDLKIYEDGKRVKTSDMSRDLKIAISEYAPDSEVIVDGSKYTSKYIIVNKKKDFTRNYFCVCSNCKKVNLYLSRTDDTKCRYCGESITSEISEYFIEPINGFRNGPTIESTRMKPKKSYAGEVSYVGGGKTDEKRLIIGNAVGIETSSDDELLVMNKNGFFMCPVCGYSEIIKKKSILTQMAVKHNNYKHYECPNENLDRLRIGHKFRTDVARFTIPMLSVSEKEGFQQALSFLYAFLEGISIALGIDRKDIDGVLEINLEWTSYDILLYDNVPGGAGHVKRLLSKDAIINSLEAALNKVSMECCDENTSCYNCLRNYYNQSYHSLMQRRYAINLIKQLLFEIGNDAEKYINERWSWNSNLSSSAKKMKLTLGSDGTNPGNETAEEIWDNILEDCYDENEINLITAVKEKSPIYISRPYYNKTVIIEETGEEINPCFVWYDKQVMLFLNDRYEDYLTAQKTGWDVFCTHSGFEAEKLLEKIGE